MYSFLADLLVLVHFLFVVFVVIGGFMVLKWRKIMYLHIPAAIWGVMIEFSGWICPLTPLENWLRSQAGESGYSGDFIQHYILPVLYPAGLTREVQFILGSLVLIINFSIYFYLLKKRTNPNH